MLATSVDFHTNVDCCKPFMRGMSGIAISYINPVVGDQITVYNCSGVQIVMHVVERKWVFVNQSVSRLECWLAPPNDYSIEEFTKHCEEQLKR